MVTREKSVAELVKPVVEVFPYTYDSLHDAVGNSIRLLAAYDEACARLQAMDPLGDGVSPELEAARELLDAADITFEVRYPDLGRVSGWSEKLPDRIVTVSVSPVSLTRYVGQRTLFEFVGRADDATYTVRMAEDGIATLDVETYR